MDLGFGVEPGQGEGGGQIHLRRAVAGGEDARLIQLPDRLERLPGLQIVASQRPVRRRRAGFPRCRFDQPPLSRLHHRGWRRTPNRRVPAPPCQPARDQRRETDAIPW